MKSACFCVGNSKCINCLISENFDFLSEKKKRVVERYRFIMQQNNLDLKAYKKVLDDMDSLKIDAVYDVPAF